MTKKSDRVERHRIYELAEHLWKHGERLKELRQLLGLSRAEFARRSGLSVAKVAGVERSGRVGGSFWLLCEALRQVKIDFKRLDDERYMDNKRAPKNDPMKGGGQKVREKWWGHDDPAFQDWVHKRKQKKKIRRDLTKREIEDWYDDWVAEGKPDLRSETEE